MAQLTEDGQAPPPILAGAFSTRHVSPAILQHRIIQLTQERDTATRERDLARAEADSLAEQLRELREIAP